MTRCKKSSYTLSHKHDAELPKKETEYDENHFNFPIILKNILWFCRLRWMVIFMLLAYGLSNLVPDLAHKLSLRPPGVWPFATLAFLSIVNLIYLRFAKKLLTRKNKWLRAKINLWAQIIVDLLVLSVVIHNTGILGTYFGFLYLFHITLACIFMARLESLLVTIYSSILYVLVLFAEVRGVKGFYGIFTDTSVARDLASAPEIYLLNLFFLVGIFFVLWYLISFLSLLLWKRNKDLRILNERLRLTQKTKDEYMLRTTHELKAPFAAIRSNVQLLRNGYCGDLPKEAMDILVRIESRCDRLSTEIVQMLQLSNLRFHDNKKSAWIKTDLAEELSWAIKQLQYTSDRKKVRIKAKLKKIEASVLPEQIKVLFSNLLSNSINYSRPEGLVIISCSLDSLSRPLVSFEDSGIGILPSKLPKIFDEYYRTDEAAEHNKSSSGLGLAIARKIAQNHAIDITVESIENKGSKFILVFNNIINVSH